MKILFFAIAIYFIINTPFNVVDPCNLDTAKMATEARRWEQISFDGKRQNVLATRFLHNKVGVFLSEFSKCYFRVYDFNMIAGLASIVGLAFWLYFVYKIFTTRNYLLTSAFILMPVLPFLKSYPILIPLIHKMIALGGGFYWIMGKK